MNWKEQIAMLLCPDIFQEAMESRETISDLNADLEEKESSLVDCHAKIEHLNNQIEQDAKERYVHPLEEYCSKNFNEVHMFAYEDKRDWGGQPISMYPNEMIQPDMYMVDAVRDEIKFVEDKYKWYEAVGKNVANRATWTRERKDRYNYPNETIVARGGDCDDFAGLVASIEPEIGIAFGQAPGGTWHAWNVFVHQGKLYTMETNNVSNVNAFKIIKQDGRSRYKMNYIFTKDKTFVVDNSVQFGRVVV